MTTFIIDTGDLSAFDNAVERVRPGDSILLRGGIYRNFMRRIRRLIGKEQGKITLRSYDGERAILDASAFDEMGEKVNGAEAILDFEDCEWLVVRDLDAQHSPMRGITTQDCLNFELDNTTVHHTYLRGIGGSGKHLRFTNSEVHHACLINVDHRLKGKGGWPAAVMTWNMSDGQPSENVWFEGFYVHHSWGEGIMLVRVNNAIATNNVVHDVYSANYYGNKGERLEFSGNVGYTTDKQFWKYGENRAAHGILIASENLSSNSPYSQLISLTALNNLLFRVHNGIRYWDDTRQSSSVASYSDMWLAHNYIWGTDDTAVKIDQVKQGKPPFLNKLHSNIVHKGKNGKWLEIGDKEAWSLISNHLHESMTSIAEGKDLHNRNNYRLPNNSPLLKQIHKGNAVGLLFDYATQPVVPDPILEAIEEMINANSAMGKALENYKKAVQESNNNE